MKTAIVIGAGLAGSEAAWQLAQRGIKVTLCDMKPKKMSPAHKLPGFAELVCSNSLRSDRVTNAAGLLKQELRKLDSLIMRAADASKIPAGGALAVDREKFSQHVTQALYDHKNITIFNGEITEVPDTPCIIATGPLTGDALAANISRLDGLKSLEFYDAVAPIISRESINMDIAFYASRYGRGDDYINCPINELEYNAFYDELVNAETVDVRGFEDDKVFEGCMPIEIMAKRGYHTIAYGPLKPVGLIDPRTNKQPYAVVQLRQDDAAATLYNMVGFQTRLTYAEQNRVFKMIPGLENADIHRYGVMHRNTFINSPGFLKHDYSTKINETLYFAGQITGVEGYVESTASGLIAGYSLACKLAGIPAVDFTDITAIGALGAYVTRSNSHFQPMNINFGIMQPLEKNIRKKTARYEEMARRSIDYIHSILGEFLWSR